MLIAFVTGSTFPCKVIKYLLVIDWIKYGFMTLLNDQVSDCITSFKHLDLDSNEFKSCTNFLSLPHLLLKSFFSFLCKFM